MIVIKHIPKSVKTRVKVSYIKIIKVIFFWPNPRTFLLCIRKQNHRTIAAYSWVLQGRQQ